MGCSRVRYLGYALPWLLLAGCGGGADSVAAANTNATPTSSTAPSARPHHVCVPKPYPYPPPGPALDFVVEGHSTGERFLTLGPYDVSVRFTMTQHPGVTVTRLQFVIAAMHSTSPNINVRTFPVVREMWGPGVHTATVRWDGNDDHGQQVPAGRYRIEARVSGTVPLPVTCQDGSGQGIELLTGVSGMDLNVYVRVPKPS